MFQYKMIQLPPSETYERELEYMPYRKSLERVTDIVCAQTPNDGDILDLMCGPGFLLRQIRARRKNLGILWGTDIEPSYISYASSNDRLSYFDTEDALLWPTTGRRWDVVLCTGALHHISYERQEEMIERMSHLVAPDGFAIISDCYADDYNNEQERKIAAAKLGYEYLVETIKNGAPEDVVKATADILTNDVMGLEFKTSLHKRMQQFQKHFRTVEIEQTWPIQRKLNLAERNTNKLGYGDYIALLRR